ncbi:general stress protein [Amycolatopsis alkalitolerans]|uniref:Magnesium transporter n=1 Tax=Amycolatopsis alkalitolerans TaxID=2547244 RepID=A0A5C4LVA2_9PSEU|nr:general stress protein [Amycolatopsis alkalitolerans]TNC22456.1 magnesium transporter [Amycolatopsis alkalitolerans]
MTTAFTQTAFSNAPANPKLPTLPTGWPIGSYASYEEAQRAVDHLADSDFPVADVTIVGVEPMLVERVAGKLSWGRVLGNAAMSGAWFGLFVGLLLSWFSAGAGLLAILIGLVAGVAFSMVFAAVGYGASRGRRDFISHSQLVARRYDVLSQPRNAERGRELLANLAARANLATS